MSLLKMIFLFLTGKVYPNDPQQPKMCVCLSSNSLAVAQHWYCGIWLQIIKFFFSRANSHEVLKRVNTSSHTQSFLSPWCPSWCVVIDRLRNIHCENPADLFVVGLHNATIVMERHGDVFSKVSLVVMALAACVIDSADLSMSQGMSRSPRLITTK